MSDDASLEADVLALRSLMLDLINLQSDLHAALEGQLDSVRRADVDGLQQSAAAIGALNRRFESLDLHRRAVVARLAGAVGRGRGEPALSDIARAFEPPRRNELMSLATALRERMMAVADAQRVSQIVCREMSDHFRCVLDAMAQAASPGAGYERSGRSQPGGLTTLDATG